MNAPHAGAPPFGVPRVGVGVLIQRGDRVLLVRRSGPHGGGTWSTPGGHLDTGETPDQCAIRETAEETGVRLASATFYGLTNDIFPESGAHYITIWMRGEIAADSGDAIINAPDELDAVGWFAWDDLPGPLFLSLQNLLAGRGYGAAAGHQSA